MFKLSISLIRLIFSGNGQHFHYLRQISATNSWNVCRFGAEAIIDPSEDFTRVALDAIAYCSMSYRWVFFFFRQQIFIY